jgi:alanyl-tRNA synthetase
VAPLDANGVRKAFLDLQRQRGHVILRRAPLVPRDDPTTLFTGSGMQALLPYLLGTEHPAGTRLADSQTCLRSQDIGDVGDNRHTTFFEMLGNWSLGDYFKAEQLPAAWTLLVDRLGLDPARVYVSCFAGDPAHGIPKDVESAEIWRNIFRGAGLDGDEVDLGSGRHGGEVGNQGARIAFYGEENWWCRGGTAETMPVGDPGGPDSEMFYLYPQVEHDPAYGRHCHQNCDCGRYVEIGNSVFMQYRRTEHGFEPLPRRNVDFGAGLERLAAAVIDSPDIYRISLLWPIVQRLEALAATSYAEKTSELRIIADHLRGATFLAIDGIRPSNKEQGYVMRRLLRRAIRIAYSLGLDQSFFAETVPMICDLYQDTYPAVDANRDNVLEVLLKEEKSFRRTLARGLEHLEAFRGQKITGATLFTLYDTYGFPVELSTEEAGALGVELSADWLAEFDDKMAEQRERSQTAAGKHHT